MKGRCGHWTVSANAMKCDVVDTAS